MSEQVKGLEDWLNEERADKDARIAVLEEALTLIAAPKRADGTYNRCREACELLALEALSAGDEKKED